MSTRKIKDAKDLSDDSLIYFKGHAKATYMSNGTTVEDAINNIETGKTSVKTYTFTYNGPEADVPITQGEIDEILNADIIYLRDELAYSTKNVLYTCIVKNITNYDILSLTFYNLDDYPDANIYYINICTKNLTYICNNDYIDIDQYIKDTIQSEELTSGSANTLFATINEEDLELFDSEDSVSFIIKDEASIYLSEPSWIRYVSNWSDNSILIPVSLLIMTNLGDLITSLTGPIIRIRINKESDEYNSVLYIYEFIGYNHNNDLIICTFESTHDDAFDMQWYDEGYAIGKIKVMPNKGLNGSDSTNIDLSEYPKKSELAIVATTGSYNDLIDTPTIPAAITEATVSNWGFTKNNGTYSKPNNGIPKSDLASSIQTTLTNADTVYGWGNHASAGYLKSETYKGTVTGVKINGTTKNPSSGIIDLGTVITSHQDISGKQDKLISGTNIKTINGNSILGSGNIIISGSSSTESSVYSEINHGTEDTTFTIIPNTFHVWDTVSSLTLTLGEETSGVANEYLFQFTSGTEPTTLSLPSDIKFNEELVIEANKIYQISILKGLGTIMSWITKKIIVFSIEDNTSITYQAEEGMTWEEWVNSEYNVDGYLIFDGYDDIYPPGSDNVLYSPRINNVTRSDIISTQIYTITYVPL